MASQEINNLPPELFQFSGDWEAYGEALYEIFQNTLLNKILLFQGLRVGIRRLPEYKDKHFAFWHLISEGEKEEERTPDFRRCERLAWVSWVIQNCDNCAEISWWENTRNSEKNIVIWYEKENYAVILARRKDYFLLKTAYCLTPHRTIKFALERDGFRKNRNS